MAEENNTTPAKPAEKLDLASLSGLDFGPNWADSSKPSHSNRDDRGPRPRSGGGGSRAGHDDGNRRGGGGRSDSSGNRDRRGNARRPSDERPTRGRGERDERSERSPLREKPFEPTVKIDIYPQDEAFDALVKRLQSSARTYQLFDITRLLLEKPERYVVLVSPKPGKQAEAPAQLYYSIPGHLPFETEAEAINYVLSEHLDRFFDVEEVECDPPSGNFLMINRCGITGTLLGPPNYHRYQEFAQKHFAANITGTSFERFQSKIESTKEQEAIDAWLDSMKKRSRYLLKERAEGEPEAFDTFEAARLFLLSHRKDKIVATSESVRFAGKDLSRLPQGDIRRSIESYVELQKHFPLDTANNIRGRLRRHNFTVYKKGSKGASFVCAVKRKFRDEKTIFTDSIRNLIEFIEKHPDLPASKLPKLYIGIDTEKQQPEELKIKDAPAQTAEVETASGDESAVTADTLPEVSDVPVDAPAQPEADAQIEGHPEATESVASGEPTTPAPEVTPVIASTDAQPKSTLTSEEQAKLRQLMLDLRWLITEGYVTEYGDGKLFTPPPMPPVKKAEPKPKTEPKSEPQVEPKPEPKTEPKPEPQASHPTAVEEAEDKPETETEGEDPPADSTSDS